MAETTPVAKPAFAPFSVSRKVKYGNEEVESSLTFEPVLIKRSKEKKGQSYPSVKVTEQNLPQVIAWLGNDVLVSLLKGKMNSRFQGLYEEACTDLVDGKEVPKPFDLDEFKALASAFSARGETIGDIDDEIEELTDELSSIDWSNPQESVVAAQRIGERIKQLRIQRESKKRQPKAEDATKSNVTVV